ncbi:VWA domain-containing protein [Sediminibacter sp. Hel_I_10]|uniref:VWA domain-containing protein n=1 Tax=Sediminibacter sp. Hel_I_10 TaxID=1392490 RepID=UPI00047E904A|nr:VWA domain-containing protein [Sediminibacter sp. Hel_I_10]
MKHLLHIAFILLLSLNASAQEREIHGIVTSAGEGLPLPGASVIIKGTSKGTQTDFDGKYVIRAKPQDVLIFSYVGLKRQDIKVNDASEINVALEEDNAALEEVVVTGYAGITNDFYRKSKSTVSYALSGTVSGVQINTTQRSNSAIKIRGVASATNSEPLFVLDGVPITESEFRAIKTKDIKHVEILNAQQGGALYGYQGSKGVICLRTKGQKNNPDLSIVNEFLNESYEQIQENPFKRSEIAPLSTFSIDVDKAAYSNIRRMINNGQKIPKDAVKIEEMVNYFNYAYAQPNDEHPFSIDTEVAKTPWHDKTKLVKIGLQGKTYENEALPASNLTFLIDVSGSMDATNKLHLLKSAFKLLVNQLRAKDHVSIVVYAGAAGVVLEPTSGDDKEKIISALERLQAGGSTAGGAGIELAYQLAEKNYKKDGNNRVILATDGDFNVGASSDKAMETLIEEKRKSGVFLSVLGFGYGNYQDSKLETLADKGNGNHSYIDNMQEAQKVFGKEFGGTLYTIAKDVKIQVEFNPKKVQAYRLIGYENRLLADEDFIDDTKDAGELGSGHTVTALYEIIPVGVKTDYLQSKTTLKYTKVESLDDYDDELFTVKFRYKKPDGSKSIEMVHVQKDIVNTPTKDMSFAAAVALFGMELRASKYANNAQIQDVIKLAKAGRGIDENGYRSEFIRLVESHSNL